MAAAPTHLTDVLSRTLADRVDLGKGQYHRCGSGPCGECVAVRYEVERLIKSRAVTRLVPVAEAAALAREAGEQYRMHAATTVRRVPGQARTTDIALCSAHSELWKARDKKAEISRRASGITPTRRQ